jgi:hypothetical protein
VGDERVNQVSEKRQLAALIRQYAAWLDTLDKTDLLAYAASIEAEADRLDRGHAGRESSASAPRKPGVGPPYEG